MSFQVLSRKWRPKKFQEVVGQEHITRSLQNAINRKRLGHAYIFTGTRGIGKTSVARLFAKALRCTEISEDGNSCGKCEACEEFMSGSSMNIMEIDGASNNSVDDIRELITTVHSLPTSGEYKVYIIDEVHMLSTSAFNALLKTLEEPPAHVIFLLATTEPHKLLSTVLSRCQRFDFRNASVETLVTHLSNIIKQEDIEIENIEYLKTVALQAKGSFRDALSLMDQIISYSNGEKITADIISMALGLAKTSSIQFLVEGLLEGKVYKVSNRFQEMLHENVNLINICEGVLNYLYELIQNIDSTDKFEFSDEFKKVFHDVSAQELFWIYETLAQDWEWATRSILPEKVVEITLQKVTLRRDFFFREKITSETKEQKIEEALINNVTNKVIDQSKIFEKTSELKKIIEQNEQAEDIEIKQEQAVLESNIAEEISELIKVDKTWDNFLIYLKSKSPATASNLEQGNLTKDLIVTTANLDISLGFRPSGKVFVDHLNESSVFAKLNNFLSDFFEITEDKIKIVLEIVKKNPESSFQTKVEIQDKKEENIKEERHHKIYTDPIVLGAEELFGTKVDKVKLNSEE